LVTLPKKFWTRVLGSIVIQLHAGECTLSVDQALKVFLTLQNTVKFVHSLLHFADKLSPILGNILWSFVSTFGRWNYSKSRLHFAKTYSTLSQESDEFRNQIYWRTS